MPSNVLAALLTVLLLNGIGFVVAWFLLRDARHVRRQRSSDDIDIALDVLSRIEHEARATQRQLRSVNR